MKPLIMPIRIAIHGAAGRMGQRLVALAAADPAFSVVAAIDATGHPRLGEDAGVIAGVAAVGVPLADRLDAAVDAVIDFSLPAAAEKIIEICRQRKIPLVEATTGFDEGQTKKLHAAAEEIPLLWSPNMSLAVNLTMKLTELAAEALADRDADVEIIERHHRFKEDAPSGTALKFGRIVADAMGQTVAVTAAKAGRANARIRRSAFTRFAPATIRASTRSSSACWAKRSN